MWPDGMRGAAALTFDFDAEEVWIGEDPANANKPSVLSQGTYGAKVAVPLILELLERHGITATFFVPARVAERHAERVRQIVDAGHELAHHGYTHTSPTTLSAAEEEEELTKGLGILRSFGTEVVRLPVAVVGFQRRDRDTPREARVHLLLQLHGRPEAVPARGHLADRGPDPMDDG